MGKIKKEGNAIKLGTLINLVIVLVVLGIAFLIAAPETGNKISSLSEITIGALAVFVLITIIRMIMASRRK